jgi:D-alanine transaminase
MGRIVYVNGEFVPEEEAKVSIFDRGYYFGDGVYEVVPVIGGRMIDKAPFLARLGRSLAELGIAWPCSEQAYVAFHEELIGRNNIVEGLVYSQVTRGVAEREFTFPKDVRPAVMAFTQVKKLLDNPLAETGVKVATVEDIRWKRRDVKSIALLGQVMAKQQAAEKGAFEAWMVEDGNVTEGSSSSAYIVKDGVIITRPLSRDILPGIRRKVILELAAKHQVRIEERAFSVDEALSADEAFLTAASTFVLPVVAIDGHKVGDGTPGPVARQMRALYIAAGKAEAGLQ